MKPLKISISLIAVLSLLHITLPAQGRCMFEKTRPITLEGGKYRPIRFGNTKRNFNLKGSFEAYGSKISVYIVDVENYARLINFKKFEPIYLVEKATKGEIDIDLDMGNYHLVFWNESTDKTVVIEAEVCFVHPNQVQE